MAIQTELIKTNPYFTGMSNAAFDSISKVLFEKKAKRGELLLFEGDPAEALYFVVSGAVKVFKTSADGKEQILSVIKPGESFNDVPAFSNGTNLASAEAMIDVVLYGLKKSDLEVFLKEHPRAALNIIKVLSQRVQHLVSLVEDLSFRHVTGRIARILVETTGDGTGGASPRLTQQEMAAMAGTAREMVGRSLKSLEEDGNIRMERHRIIITNKKALEAIAGVHT